MCALLNFIKVFCIVLHILTFHSLRWSIYSPPPPHAEGGHDLRELQVTIHLFVHFSQREKNGIWILTLCINSDVYKRTG